MIRPPEGRIRGTGVLDQIRDVGTGRGQMMRGLIGRGGLRGVFAPRYDAPLEGLALRLAFDVTAPSRTHPKVNRSPGERTPPRFDPVREAA